MLDLMREKPSRHGSRALIVASNFPPVVGGSAMVYDNLARCAAGRIVVLAPRCNYADGTELAGWREHDAAVPYRVVRLGLLRTPLDTPRAGLPRIGFRLRDAWLRACLAAAILRVAIQERASVVCVGELHVSHWLFRLLRVLPGLRSIAYVHGEEITVLPSLSPRQRRQTLGALVLADGVVAVSDFTRQTIAAVSPDAAKRLSLVPNGVEHQRFTPGPRLEELVHRYRLAGCFVFVSVCRLIERKGIDRAIAAFAVVAQRHPDCRLLIVGTGPCEAELRRLAVACGVAEMVRFAGRATEAELVDHYRLGDAFLMPNRRLPDGDTEGFGLVFLEANACGLPVIAGREGGATSAVLDGKTGLVVDGDSIEEIAAAMCQLRERPELRARLSTAGLAHARASGWDARARDFLALCDRLAGDLPNGRPRRPDGRVLRLRRRTAP